MHEVSFAHTHVAVDVERVVGVCRVGGDGLSGGMSKLVAGADDEAAEGVLRIEACGAVTELKRLLAGRDAGLADGRRLFGDGDRDLADGDVDGLRRLQDPRAEFVLEPELGVFVGGQQVQDAVGIGAVVFEGFEPILEAFAASVGAEFF